MVKIETELKTYSHETSVAKFNLMDLSLAEIEQDIEYLLFIEHEEDMKGYLHLKPLVEEIAKMVVRKVDSAVTVYQRDLTLRIADKIKGEIQDIVLGERFETTEKRRVDVTIDDEKVVDTQIVAVDAPAPSFENTDNDW